MLVCHRLASPCPTRWSRSEAPTAERGAGLPLTPTKALKFTTDEGTWLSLDLSPDGRTIVFELLGDIYTMPIDGGKATRLTSGQPFDAQPHYSPDGKSIVFVSDRSQSDNLWIMNADGIESARADARERSEIPVADLHARRQVRRGVEGQRHLHVLRERRHDGGPAAHRRHGGGRAWRRRAGRRTRSAPRRTSSSAQRRARTADTSTSRCATAPAAATTRPRSAGRSACSIARRDASSRRRTPSAAACAPS